MNHDTPATIFTSLLLQNNNLVISQSKSPEYSYSFTDVANFPDLTVQLFLLFTLLLCPSQSGPSCSLEILNRHLFL